MFLFTKYVNIILLLSTHVFPLLVNKLFREKVMLRIISGLCQIDLTWIVEGNVDTYTNNAMLDCDVKKRF